MRISAPAVRNLLAIRSIGYEFLLTRFLTAFTRTGQPTATLSGVSQQSLEAVLAIRSSGQALYLEGFDPPNIPGDPGTDVWNGGDPFGSVLSELRAAIQPEVSYYIQDHLGNTRVMYHTDLLSCQDYDVLYRLEHVLDYYPYGKTLREYVPGPREKFQSTEHERDLETGLDHRGARMYDGDVGRFLGVDPLGVDYSAMSAYNYVLGNPNLYIDPSGQSPEGWSQTNVDLANRFGVFGNLEEMIQPDKEGALTIEELIADLREAGADDLKKMKDYFKYSTFQRPFYRGKSRGQGEPWKFIYTKGVGWVDITHFNNAALIGLTLGEGVEFFQFFTLNKSAWSYEDLQSNLQGVLFVMHNGRNLEGEEFYSALEDWFIGLHADSPENAPNWSMVPPTPQATGAYGDNGAGSNLGLPIPQNRGYSPVFAPLYHTLPKRYTTRPLLDAVENSRMKYKF